MFEMLIKGIQKTSFIDYAPYTATVLFLGGCNFRCGFCHNVSMVKDYESLPDIKEEEVMDFLNSKKKWIDGIVITGGEPTLYPDLPDFLAKIKKAGFLVKLDTNGTNPEMIDLFIGKELVDFISMDIKSSLDRYNLAAGCDVNIEKVKKSVSLLMQGIVDYEFRMTVVPGLVEKGDFKKIGEWLKGASLFVVQQFRNDVVLDEKFKKTEPFTKLELEEFKKELEPFFNKVEIRGV